MTHSITPPGLHNKMHNHFWTLYPQVSLKCDTIIHYIYSTQHRCVAHICDPLKQKVEESLLYVYLKSSSEASCLSSIDSGWAYAIRDTPRWMCPHTADEHKVFQITRYIVLEVVFSCFWWTSMNNQLVPSAHSKQGQDFLVYVSRSIEATIRPR